jgi:hypothetical protein
MCERGVNIICRYERGYFAVWLGLGSMPAGTATYRRHCVDSDTSSSGLAVVVIKKVPNKMLLCERESVSICIWNGHTRALSSALEQVGRNSTNLFHII